MVFPSPRPVLHPMLDSWINDPNGLVFRDGLWHAFAQHNPSGPTWGNMSWGHWTSTDLVCWQRQPVAILHDADHGCFSGSAVVDVANSAGFGAGALVAVYTAAHHLESARLGTQTQWLAHSLDGVTFTKSAGPVLDRGSADFRDPKVFWDEPRGRWVMVAVEATDNAVLIYHSDDLTHWVLASEFTDPRLVSPAWECPDLFELPVGGGSRWVLIVSVNPGGILGGSGTRWYLGDFDGTTFTADVDDPGWWLDWGSDNYAAVSFNNVPDGRRLMMGWHNNWKYSGPLAEAGFPGMLTVVREVSLVEDGSGPRLRQWPVAELLDAGRSAEPHLDESGMRVPAVCWVELTLLAEQTVSFGSVKLTWTAGELRLDRAALSDLGADPRLGDLVPATSVTAPVRQGLSSLSLGLLIDDGSLEVFADDGRTVLSSLQWAAADCLAWTGEVEQVRLRVYERA